MAILAFEFFFRLLLGWNFFLFFVSRAESSEAFLKVSARFSIGFAAIALVCAVQGGMGNLEYGPVIFLAISTLCYLSRKHLILRLISILFFLLAPVLVYLTRGPLVFVNVILSAAVLGGAFVTQFLGHWFLNVPNIHIRELKRITNLSFAALILRTLGVFAICFFLGNAAADPGVGHFPSDGEFFSIKGDTWLGMGAFGLLLFSARVLFGLVAPLVLTWMAKKTVQMRSTQSATGIFYANSVLMLLGELCALFLEKNLWPM
jgi:hypothetical protein